MVLCMFVCGLYVCRHVGSYVCMQYNGSQLACMIVVCMLVCLCVCEHLTYQHLCVCVHICTGSPPPYE